MKRRIIVSLLAGAVLMGLCGLKGAYADKEEHEFTLFQRKGLDPYTLTFPFRVEGAGMIRASIKINSAEKKKNSVAFSLMKKGSKNSLAHGGYNGKNESYGLQHAVDSTELDHGKEYVVVLNNLSPKRVAKGSLMIVYYGKNGPPEEAKPVHPDLAVTGMSLNNQNQLQVEIANNGPGRLSNRAYEDNELDLTLTRNGKNWGGVSLRIADPHKRLQEPGGKTTYTFDTFTVNGKESVKAVIDSKRKCPEENEKNNGLIQRVGDAGAPAVQESQAEENKPAQSIQTGKRLQLGKKVQLDKVVLTGSPDLAIAAIFKNSDNNVGVMVINNGPGSLPAEFWKNNPPTLYLSRNGKGWGGATLPRFDPARKLMAPGGKAMYISTLKISGTETIKAVIDSQKTVPEADENNNEKTESLTAGQ